MAVEDQRPCAALNQGLPHPHLVFLRTNGLKPPRLSRLVLSAGYQSPRFESTLQQILHSEPLMHQTRCVSRAWFLSLCLSLLVQLLLKQSGLNACSGHQCISLIPILCDTVVRKWGLLFLNENLTSQNHWNINIFKIYI